MKIAFNPLVSIIIPTYNSLNFLLKSLKSALRQTYKNIEIIIIDDGSIDKTKQIIEKFILSKKLKNVFYFYKKNGGTASALNYGIKKAKGEYISWLSSDDIYKKNKIKLQIDCLNKLTNKETIIYSDYGLILNNFFYIKNIISRTYDVKKNDLNNWLWAISATILNGCTLLIKKNIILSLPFNEELKAVQDYDAWIRFYQNNISLFFIKKNLVYYRKHKNQTSNLKKDVCILENAEMRINLYNNLNKRELVDLKGNEYSFFKWIYYIHSDLEENDLYKKFLLKKINSYKEQKNEDFSKKGYRKLFLFFKNIFKLFSKF